MTNYDIKTRFLQLAFDWSACCSHQSSTEGSEFCSPSGHKNQEISAYYTGPNPWGDALASYSPTHSIKLCELISARHQSRVLRSIGSVRLQVPKTDIPTYGDRAFSVAGPMYLRGWHLALTLLLSMPSWRHIFLGVSLIICLALCLRSHLWILRYINFIMFVCKYINCPLSKDYVKRLFNNRRDSRFHISLFLCQIISKYGF
jgi:hypothetical protein